MASISVIGLGFGSIEGLTPSIIARMQATGKVYMRTKDFPLVDYIHSQGIEVQSFDDVYEAYDTFEEVYEEITKRLIAFAKEEGHIIYAVPGHPRVAERTVHLLVETGQREQIEVNLYGGQSFLDQVFLSFNFDPIEGFQLLDATSLRTEQLNPSLHTVVAQMYDRLTASDVKLTLMQSYPDEYPVWLGSYLGTDQEVIRKLPLYEIDHIDDWNNFSLLYVPRATEESTYYRRFDYVKNIVTILRSPNGCPWDREQTHESIRKNLIEETYEVIDAIDAKDMENLQEELGDLLLQILLHSQMAEEEGYFDVFDVIYGLSDKLIRRHPHVFGENKANNANEALQNWQEMKIKEKAAKGIDTANESILSGIPRSLPAILTAYKLQKKAASVGFDWSDVKDVMAKVEEEWKELKAATDEEQRLEEYGDLLFAIVNLARFLKLDPEQALALANRKFKERFSYIEEKLHQEQKSWNMTSLEEMEEWWQEAKKLKTNEK